MPAASPASGSAQEQPPRVTGKKIFEEFLLEAGVLDQQTLEKIFLDEFAEDMLGDEHAERDDRFVSLEDLLVALGGGFLFLIWGWAEHTSGSHARPGGARRWRWHIGWRRPRPSGGGRGQGAEEQEDGHAKGGRCQTSSSRQTCRYRLLCIVAEDFFLQL
jgi:hypothetical protein